MLESFTTQTFAERVGETFRILRDGEPPVEVALAEVTVLGESVTGAMVRAGAGGGGGGRTEAFSLVFHAPRGAAVLPQQIYRVEHDAVGAFELFLVPLGPDPATRGGPMRYEAVFT